MSIKKFLFLIQNIIFDNYIIKEKNKIERR